MQASVSLLYNDFRHIIVVVGDSLTSARYFFTMWPQSLSDAAGQTRKGWEVAKNPGPRALIYILRAGGQGQGKRGHLVDGCSPPSAVPCISGSLCLPAVSTSHVLGPAHSVKHRRFTSSKRISVSVAQSFTFSSLNFLSSASGIKTS